MALEIINSKIIGVIDNLENKLEGKLPVTREELLVLVNSWGRLEGFNIKDSNNQTLKIEECEATQTEQTEFVRKECYDLSKLDTSEITDMLSIFRHSNFNGDISNWNTSNVTNMERMFYNAYSFNQPLNFDTSNVTNMERMFAYARTFNQLLNFDTSKITNMKSMFYQAKSFNQPVIFDTRNVTSMASMFNNASSFNQPLNFNTSKVTSMISMFSYARVFNQPLNFDISNVISMYEMFNETNAFKDKYNNGKTLLDYTEDIKEWLNDNRYRMNDLDIKDKYGNQIDDFFSDITNLTKEIKR